MIKGHQFNKHSLWFLHWDRWLGPQEELWKMAGLFLVIMINDGGEGRVLLAFGEQGTEVPAVLQCSRQSLYQEWSCTYTLPTPPSLLKGHLCRRKCCL